MKLEKKTPEVPDIMNLPKPRPGKGRGAQSRLLALVAVLAVGGAAFWADPRPLHPAISGGNRPPASLTMPPAARPWPGWAICCATLRRLRRAR